jgi:hypothetical protein
MIMQVALLLRVAFGKLQFDTIDQASRPTNLTKTLDSEQLFDTEIYILDNDNRLLRVAQFLHPLGTHIHWGGKL